MNVIGGNGDDFLIIKRGVDKAVGRGGDDHFLLESSENVKVDGGSGFDVFEFQVLAGQTFSMTDIGEDKTVIKVFEDGERVQKITLIDVEQVDWFMVG